ncbi:MAG: hypothetical protein MZV64_43820 [Ignavibacteriales bacterium]|nr:hypothetical protein [Ignavibacteriales bacterium]
MDEPPVQRRIGPLLRRVPAVGAHLPEDGPLLLLLPVGRGRPLGEGARGAPPAEPHHDRQVRPVGPGISPGAALIFLDAALSWRSFPYCPCLRDARPCRGGRGPCPRARPAT